MQLTGIHHLTAISAKPRENLAFYVNTLGMRLVKKTVNQDDVSAYHLFYADGKANPGTDLTFFDFPAPPERRGTNSISRTGLRVAGEYSVCIAAMGWTADALRNVSADISDRPIAPILPASLSRTSAPTDSSIGTLWSSR